MNIWDFWKQCLVERRESAQSLRALSSDQLKAALDFAESYEYTERQIRERKAKGE